MILLDIRQGISAIAAPVLALPLVMHKRSMMTTEQMLRQQIVRLTTSRHGRQHCACAQYQR